MKTLKSRKAAFIFRYLLDRSLGHGSRGYTAYHTEITTTYDDGLDFVYEFDEAFPGRVNDYNHVKAAKRLYTIVKELHDDGWLDRWRLSNHDQYHPMQEPNWQFVYALPQWLLADFKEGRETPESAAERWGG